MMSTTLMRGCQQCACLRLLMLQRSHIRYFSKDSNHYEVLGVGRSASKKEIKSAFVKLSKKWHPDKNKDPLTHDKFVQINEAYRVLSKPSLRQSYDHSLKTGKPQSETFHGTPHGASHGAPKQDQSWRGKAYWQWTPGEEEAYRNFFYYTYGAGRYGVPKPTQVDVKGRNKALMFCVGLVGLGVVFQLIRWQWIYGVYLDDRQAMTNRLKAQKELSETRKIELERRVKERQKKIREQETLNKSSTKDIDAHQVDPKPLYDLSAVQR